jgi:hypothetical protein
MTPLTPLRCNSTHSQSRYYSPLRQRCLNYSTPYKRTLHMPGFLNCRIGQQYRFGTCWQ